MAEINIREGVTPDQRRNVEQSVATMIERSSRATTRARAREAERSELLKAVDSPLAKLAEQDPDAMKAIDAIRTNFRPSDDESGLRSNGRRQHLSGSMTLDVREGLEIHGTPYDFDWKWVDTDGGNFVPMSADRVAGTARIAAQVEDVQGTSSYVNAHAGVGIILRTDHEVAALGRTLRTTHNQYSIGGGPWGGHAVTEGGTELTVLENGKFVTAATDKHWHKRVSNSEVDSFDNGGFGIGDPIEVVWSMRPGNEYTLNVGAWVYAEYSNGLLGDSWARSIIDAKFIFLSLVR
ncbi:hypothetical protein ACWEO2_40085 [Nocardia sp. NPDC004278]